MGGGDGAEETEGSPADSRSAPASGPTGGGILPGATVGGLYGLSVCIFVGAFTRVGMGFEVMRGLYGLQPFASGVLRPVSLLFALLLFILDVSRWERSRKNAAFGLAVVLFASVHGLTNLPYMPFVLYVTAVPIVLFTIGVSLATSGAMGAARESSAVVRVTSNPILELALADSDEDEEDDEDEEQEVPSKDRLASGGAVEDLKMQQAVAVLAAMKWIFALGGIVMVPMSVLVAESDDPCVGVEDFNVTLGSSSPWLALWELEDDRNCSAAVMVAYAPLFGGIASACASLVFAFVADYLSKQHAGSDEVGHNVMIVRLVLWSLLLVSLGLWTVASVFAESIKLSKLISSFGFALGTVCALLISVDIFAVGGTIRSTETFQRLERMLDSDWSRGFAVLFLPEMWVLFLVLSFLNQVCRRSIGLGESPEEETGSSGWVTAWAAKQLQSIRRWNRTVVLQKSLWISFWYWIFTVAFGRLTQLFLNWLRQKLLSVSLLSTTLVYMASGLTMFLLPPVPGMPVYLCGGLIICPRAEAEFQNFWVGALYSSAVAFVVKLLAIAMQQKIIGGQLGHLVSVRRFVQINSDTMKAIKLILQVPGMNVDKVTILVGGPDWPTSVLTGIMKLSVFQMLLGSLPHAFPIALIVTAGGMLVKGGGEGGLYLALSNVLVAVATLIYPVLLILAVIRIGDTATQRKTDLEQIADDEEVKALEAEAGANEALARAAIAWPAEAMQREPEPDAETDQKGSSTSSSVRVPPLPGIWKIVLVSAVVCAHVSLLGFSVLKNQCFEPVDVMTNISLPPFNGDPSRVVKRPLGVVFNVIFAVGMVLGLVFRVGAKRQFLAALAMRTLGEEAGAD